jgi:hypothetical protein
LKALDATMKASKFSLRKRNSMNSFAGSAFFENFQMARALMPGRRVGARRPGRARVVVDVVGDGHLVGERAVVRADRIVDPGTLAGEDEAVVAGVVPRQHFGIHRVKEERLVPLEDLAVFRS